jgi:hypothetical protein
VLVLTSGLLKTASAKPEIPFVQSLVSTISYITEKQGCCQQKTAGWAGKAM